MAFAENNQRLHRLVHASSVVYEGSEDVDDGSFFCGGT
jgi:hypothetical protein